VAFASSTAFGTFAVGHHGLFGLNVDFLEQCARRLSTLSADSTISWRSECGVYRAATRGSLPSKFAQSMGCG